jgi:hypothetical protein
MRPSPRRRRMQADRLHLKEAISSSGVNFPEAMKQPTGRIDPDSATLYALNRVALSEESVAFQGSLRERIIQAALGEVGKVSDKLAAGGKRQGSQALKGYFDTAGTLDTVFNPALS